MAVRVTCAIIEFVDKVLVVQRSIKMNLPLKWEFPGGKIEEGEREEECIVREIKEELNLDIEISKKLNSTEYHYPNISIELIPFVVTQVGTASVGAPTVEPVTTSPQAIGRANSHGVGGTEHSGAIGSITVV